MHEFGHIIIHVFHVSYMFELDATENISVIQILSWYFSKTFVKIRSLRRLIFWIFLQTTVFLLIFFAKSAWSRIFQFQYLCTGCNRITVRVCPKNVISPLKKSTFFKKSITNGAGTLWRFHSWFSKMFMSKRDMTFFLRHPHSYFCYNLYNTQLRSRQ